MTRIILADAHGMMRDGLKVLLKRLPNVVVIGEAADGRAAIALASELRPDIVIMDIAMPDLNGIDATRQLIAGGIENGHPVKVVALSGCHTVRNAAAILDAGVMAFVCKESAFEELEIALDAVINNRVYISPIIADALKLERSKNGDALSAREREVLLLIAEGKATKEIAMHVNLSIKTIETHRRNLMEKLKIYSVAELTKYAIREGMTSSDPV